MCVGVQAYDSYVGQDKSIIESRAFHSDHQKDGNFRRELSGRDVNRYWSSWDRESWISYGKWLAHPRDPWFFDGERIIIREITGVHPQRILASITGADFVTYKTVLNLKIGDQDIKSKWSLVALLGLLNSTLFSWVFGLIANKQEKKAFPRISLFDLKRLPVVRDPDQNLLQEIADLVEAQVKSAQSTKTTQPETDVKIDQLVYALYGLTPDEIAIVESVNPVK